MGAAGRQAIGRTSAEARKHWIPELFLGAAYAMLVLSGVESPAVDGPLFLAAIIPPLALLLVALILGVVVLLLHHPFADHRKLLWERDQLETDLGNQTKTIMRLRLSQDLRVREEIARRIDQMRKAEAIEDERMRARTISENSAAQVLVEWAQQTGGILREGGLDEVASSFDLQYSSLQTADQNEKTLQDLTEVVHRTLEAVDY